MKILHYIPSIDRTSGGTTVYMQLLGKALGRLVELHIVTHPSEHAVEIPNTIIHYISNNICGNLKNEWIKVLLKLKPDIVHINCCWRPQMAFVQFLAQTKSYKVVLTPHGMLEPWIIKRNYLIKKLPALTLFQKAAVSNAIYLHATAESEKENLLKLGYNKNIQVIPNGIETENISLKTDWTVKKKILFLSRVHVKKGIELLIESVARLKEQMKGYEVIIAGEGDGKYIQQLINKASMLGVGHIIQFSGGVYGDTKWNLFQEADIFVLPTYSENFGIVVAEALACGTPVITTRGTPWQELETEGCGWWIETGTEALVNALKEYISLDANQLEQMGWRGADLVKSKYSSEKMANDMLKLYQKVISL